MWELPLSPRRLAQATYTGPVCFSLAAWELEVVAIPHPHSTMYLHSTFHIPHGRSRLETLHGGSHSGR